MTALRTLPGALAAAAALTGLTIAGAPGPAAAVTPPPGVALPGSAAPFTSHLRPDGRAAQQGQRTPFGFLNPVLYRMPGTGALRDVLPVTGRTPSLFRGLLCDARTCFQKSLNVADDENPRMLNYFGQATRPGYDTMTGLGTPAGQRFVTVLRQLEK